MGTLAMAVDAALFVSKRASAAAAGLLCLALAHLVGAASLRTPAASATSATEVRVAIAPR